MKKLEKNFHEFTKYVEKNGQLEIPVKCVPFLGTKQRNYDEFCKSDIKQCFDKRDAAATKAKKD